LVEKEFPHGPGGVLTPDIGTQTKEENDEGFSQREV
jgi:hypothetical protein